MSPEDDWHMVLFANGSADGPPGTEESTGSQYSGLYSLFQDGIAGVESPIPPDAYDHTIFPPTPPHYFTHQAMSDSLLEFETIVNPQMDFSTIL